MSDAATAYWFDCDECRDYFFGNLDAIKHASASVGIEHGLTTHQALNTYMYRRHSEHGGVPSRVAP